jgi:hypothetical protein
MFTLSIFYSIQENVPNPPCIHAQIAHDVCVEILRPGSSRRPFFAVKIHETDILITNRLVEKWIQLLGYSLGKLKLTRTSDPILINRLLVLCDEIKKVRNFFVMP